jgi:hypothetical protein
LQKIEKTQRGNKKATRNINSQFDYIGKEIVGQEGTQWNIVDTNPSDEKYSQKHIIVEKYLSFSH